MKTLIFSTCTFVASLFLSFSGYSQPVLTSSNNPEVGDAFIIYNCHTAGIAPGGSGAGVNWDFSTLIFFSKDTILYTASDTFLFPGSNLATRGAVYYAGTDSLVLWPSFFGRIAYADPQLILRYPCSYNDISTDSFDCADTTLAYFITRGADTITYDGYGTLALPGATYENVVRIHTRTTRWDSTWAFEGPGTPLSIERSDKYSWYIAGLHNPLLSVIYYNDSNSAGSAGADTIVQYSIAYRPSAVNSISEVVPAFELFPNPAVDQLNLQLHVQKSELLLICLTDMLGNEVKTLDKAEFANGVTEKSYSIGDLAKGLYLVKVQSADGMVSKIVQIN